ncbi:MAG: 30S ribosomal protein S8 [Candidatus Acetothermia bacterium]|jgi:small subunit ribosomal protein S8|nr:30S ribosomal protein S8 [Candidatus Acetothermia bacterium]MDH7505539.1 30S ribosomal protein S8 [Candidatus Acetothermia bacterium]
MDPIADMLTRIRNANERFQAQVRLPSSQLKEELARVLKEEGYIGGYKVETDGVKRSLVISLKYKGKRGKERVITGLERMSKPSRRVYLGQAEIPPVRAGLGIVILSTSQGIMADREARKRGIGGEPLCKVW